MRLDDSSTFEIFDVWAAERKVYFLVHIEGIPGDEPLYRAAIVRAEDESLSVEYVLDTWARGMWQSPTGTLHVADMHGGIHSNRSGQWVKASVGDEVTLRSIWGFSDEAMYCSGLSAQFFRKAGNRWGRFNDSLEGDLGMIGGTSENDLYVLGEEGRIFHHDGRKWSEIESATNGTLTSLLCISPTEVYFSGWSGLFLRLKDGAWQDFSSSSHETNLYRVTSFDGRIFVGSDEEGVLLFNGRELDQFAPEITAVGIRATGRRLFAWGGEVLQEFDGSSWTTREMNLRSVIPEELPGD